MAILLPENRTNVSASTVFQLARQFPVAVPESNFDSLEEEILDYTPTQSDLLPSVPREEGKPTNSKDLCSYWHEIDQMKTLEGKSRYGNIANLAKCLLSLPHSNADTERIFSIVRKIITDYRTEMEQNTLCALLACKVNNDNCCCDTDVPKELVKIAKQATMNYNRAHSSKFNYSSHSCVPHLLNISHNFVDQVHQIKTI